VAVVILISSYVLIHLGIEGKDPKLTYEQLFTIRWIYIAVPVASMIIAIIFMWRYPLTKIKVKEIQDQLVAKRTDVIVH
jgi:Na+/melibiose symporter-like transporter